MLPATVIIALGSNRCCRHGRPAETLRAALTALTRAGLCVERVSPIMTTRAVGPGGRDYANAVAVTSSALDPARILIILKDIERAFGRRRGRRWGDRVLDLDLIAAGRAMLPSRLGWRRAKGLVVPHRAMHARPFVLRPMLAVAPNWRHPVLNLTTRQLAARLGRC